MCCERVTRERSKQQHATHAQSRNKPISRFTRCLPSELSTLDSPLLLKKAALAMGSHKL
jgi:hypothetical protein